MIECKHVSKNYKNGDSSVAALDDVSLSFPDNGLIAILGESGSGKSTLLNLLGGLDQPVAGEIAINGKPLPKGADLDDYRKNVVSFCFQQANLLPELTVRDNITLCCKNVFPEKVENICKRLGIAEKLGCKASNLSGGQAQRVALARSLYRGSLVLLCDEPTGSLDESSAKGVFELLKSLSSSRLVVVVTHDRKLAIDYADRVVELKGGRVVKDDALNGKNDFESATLEEKSGAKNHTNLKMMLHCFAAHPIRSFASALMLGLGFGALIPLLSTVTQNGADVVASSVASSSSSYVAIKKSRYVDAYSSSNMFEDEIASVSGEPSLAVHQYTIAPGYGYSSPYVPGDYLADTAWRSDGIDSIFAMTTTGVAEGSEDALLPLGLTLLSGDYPQKEDQCLISDVQYSLFEKYGFVGADGHLYRASEITNPPSFVDLSPKIDVRIGQNTYRLAITGIVKTGFDRASYDISDANSLSCAISKSILSEESMYSPYSLLFVSPTVIASNFNVQTNYVPFCDFQVCLFDSLNTDVRSLRRIDYAGASTACFSNDGSAVPLKLFGAIYGGGLLKLEDIETKDYVSCLSFYSDFGELGEENRYLDSTFLFADYLPAKASNLSLLAAGNYVSKNGLPQGEAYASFVSFAKEQYTVAAKYLKKEVPDFDAGDSKTQGYLKSLYVWYLSTPELHPTAEGGFNIQEGGYIHNTFDDVTGLQITKEFMESVFEKEGFSGKEAKLDFVKSARDGDCTQRTVCVSGVNLVNDNIMHVPSSLLDDLKHFLGDAGSIRFLLAKNTHNKSEISRYVSGLDTDFGHYLLSAPAKTSYEYFGQRVFQNFSLLTSLVGGVFSFLSVALLALTLKTVSAERSKEMALRRCLGESKKDVFFALFSQSFAFGIVGFAVSLVASSVFVASLNALFLKGVPTSLKFFSLNAWGVLICLGLILVCCAASSFFSALKGAKQSLAMNLSRNS